MKKAILKRTQDHFTTRREFVKTTGRIAAVSSLAGGAIPYIHDKGNGVPDKTLEEQSGKSSKSGAPISPGEDLKVTRIDTFVLKNSWVFVNPHCSFLFAMC